MYTPLCARMHACTYTCSDVHILGCTHARIPRSCMCVHTSAPCMHAVTQAIMHAYTHARMLTFAHARITAYTYTRIRAFVYARRHVGTLVRNHACSWTLFARMHRLRFNHAFTHALRMCACDANACTHICMNAPRHVCLNTCVPHADMYTCMFAINHTRTH